MGIIARQSIKGALANYLGVAIGFVTTFFVVTRMLTQEEVGLTRMLVDAATLFASLAQLGTNSAVVKYFPYFKSGERRVESGERGVVNGERRTENGERITTLSTLHSPLSVPYNGIFGWSLLVPLVGFALVGGLLLVAHGPLMGAYVEQAPLLTDYLYLLPMLIFFVLYMTVFETNASVLMRITVPKLVREVGVRLFTLAAYLLYGFGLVGIDGFVWLFCGSYGLAMLLNLFYLLKITGFDINIFRIDRRFLDRRMATEIVRYTLFMTAAVLAGNIPLLNSLFLGAKAGGAVAGIYAIASYMANVVEVPYRSLGAISKPVIAGAVKDGDWAEVNRLGRQVSLHQLMVSLLIFYLIWINVDTLFALLPNGEQYRGGVGVVFILGLAKVVNSSFSISTDVLNYSRHYGWGLLFILVLVAAAVGLNGWFISLWGIDGSAAATLVAYVLYFIPLLMMLSRRVGFSPFGVGQLKMVALMAGLLVLDWLWRMAVAPLFGGMVLADSVAKTLVLGSVAAVGTYAWRISPTVNGMVDNLLVKIKPNKHNDYDI